MSASLSAEDKEFLAQCEEQFKDRYTERDEEFMKVYNAEPPTPPIVDPWYPYQSSQRQERRFNRRSHPYERPNDRRSGFDHNNDRGHRQRRF